MGVDNVTDRASSDEGVVFVGCSLAEVNMVIHCAARVHMMQGVSANILTEFRKVNRDTTLALARIACWCRD